MKCSVDQANVVEPMITSCKFEVITSIGWQTYDLVGSYCHICVALVKIHVVFFRDCEMAHLLCSNFQYNFKTFNIQYTCVHLYIGCIEVGPNQPAHRHFYVYMFCFIILCITSNFICIFLSIVYNISSCHQWLANDLMNSKLIWCNSVSWCLISQSNQFLYHTPPCIVL